MSSNVGFVVDGAMEELSNSLAIHSWVGAGVAVSDGCSGRKLGHVISILQARS